MAEIAMARVGRGSNFYEAVRQAIESQSLGHGRLTSEDFGMVAPQAVEVAAVEDLPVPEKAAVAIAGNAPDQEYLRLAAKLGIQSAPVLEARLEAVLADECIQVFEYNKVVEYLVNACRKVAKENQLAIWQASWSWKPVRGVDSGTTQVANVSASLYQQEIPMAVLFTMERIAERLPEAKFFVSEVVMDPDPFLSVTVEGSSKMWVVERWAEPTFRS